MALLVTFIALALMGVVWLQWRQYQWLGDMVAIAEPALNNNPRWQLLHQQGYWALMLIGAESAGLLTFVLLMLRQSHRLQKNNDTLQQTTIALEAARNSAVAANRAKGEFLATMSHEVRTPFQGLMGMLNLLEGRLENPQQREYLRNAFESSEHLLGLINDVLDISTLESGSLKLDIRPMHWPSVLTEVDNLMQIPAQEKGLSLRVSLERTQSAESPEWVMADPRRVRQILYNLISNAVKFTSEGTVEVVVKALPGIADCYLISVSDTGLGMDENTLSQLFTRFYQADTSVRRRVGGSGLGLEISRNLAQMMGGDITVSSTVGKGSVFVAMLLLPNADPTSIPTDDAIVTLGATTFRPLRVLVAEDHPINLKFLRLMLERMGHHATLCTNGAAALEMVQKQAFEVVLLDYHMPLMDGLATSLAIRNLAHSSESKAKTNGREVKIILITADSLNETRQKASLSGVDLVVLKPLLEPDLLRAFQRCQLLERAGHESPFDKTEHKVAPLDPADGQVIQVENIKAVNNFSAPLILGDHWDAVSQSLSRADLADLVENLFNAQGTAQRLQQHLARHLSAQANDTSSDNLQHIVQLAHQLKGVCLMLGFGKLADHAKALEHQAKTDPSSINLTEIEALTACAEATRVAASQRIDH